MKECKHSYRVEYDYRPTQLCTIWHLCRVKPWGHVITSLSVPWARAMWPNSSLWKANKWTFELGLILDHTVPKVPRFNSLGSFVCVFKQNAFYKCAQTAEIIANLFIKGNGLQWETVKVVRDNKLRDCTTNHRRFYSVTASHSTRSTTQSLLETHTEEREHTDEKRLWPSERRVLWKQQQQQNVVQLRQSGIFVLTLNLCRLLCWNL